MNRRILVSGGVSALSGLEDAFAKAIIESNVKIITPEEAEVMNVKLREPVPAIAVPLIQHSIQKVKKDKSGLKRGSSYFNKKSKK